MRLTAERAVLIGLLALFVCRALAAHAIVPLWQGPDEPTHFALAYGLTLPIEAQQRVQGDVLLSMVRNGWWALYDDPPPDPLPPSFDYIAGLGPGTLAQPLYYSAGAAVLRVTRPTDLEAAYVHLRVLSIVLALIALTLGWAGTRLLFGPEIAAGAAAIAALHPQFLLTAIAVNADALLNVWGAFVWWQAARVVTGRRRGFSAVLMLVGGAAALFTKRIGMVLLGIAVVVAVVSLVMRRTRHMTRRAVVFFAVAGATGAAVLLAAGLFRDAQVNTWALFLRDALTIRRPVDDATLLEAFRFARMTVDYFWLIGGWLRFQPPEPWIWVSRVLILGGMAGAAVVLIESTRQRESLALAWWFVIAQVVAMLIFVFWAVPSAPQARYLFPVFAPITALLYIGLRRLIPRTCHQQWPVALLVVLAMLDVTGFTTVHIPTYIP